MPFLSIPLFSLSGISSWVVRNTGWREESKREKRQFFVDLRCYILFSLNRRTYDLFYVYQVLNLSKILGRE